MSCADGQPSKPSTSLADTSSQKAQSYSKLIVNRKQEGNPVLKYVRSVPYEWSNDVRPDYVCGSSCGVLYLTLKWHKLHPSYMETRCNDLNAYEIKILLVCCNIEDPTFLLRDLNIYCYRNKWTLIVAYSVEEAGEYIENMKLSERRNPASTIRAINDYKQKRMNAGKPISDQEKNREKYEGAVKFLSSIKSVTTSDAKRLLGSFGSVVMIAKCSADQINMCPGLGEVKSQRIFDFFHSPLIITVKSKK